MSSEPAFQLDAALRIRLLLVDDEPDFKEVMLKHLSRRGIRLSVAECCLDALDELDTAPADVVIMALGTSSNPLIRMTTPGLETDKWGGIVVNGPEGLTSREKVYAGGDVVTGSATVILAMGAGKDAAKAIDRMIREKNGETVK